MESKPSWDDYDRAAKKARKNAGNKKLLSNSHCPNQARLKGGVVTPEALIKVCRYSRVP